MGKKKVKVSKTFKEKLLQERKNEVLEKYIKHEGNITVQSLVAGTKVSISQAKAWIAEGDWEEKYKTDRTPLSVETVELLSSAAEDFGITEQEEQLVYHVLRLHNVTQAAINAGYNPQDASRKGREVLNKENVKAFRAALIERMNAESFITGAHVLEMYEKIAFADINDIVEITSAGYIKPKRNFDGQIVDSIAESKDGIKISLNNRMEALKVLAKHTNMTESDTKYVEKQLELMEAKINIERARLGEDERKVLNDGFTDALKNSVGAAWDDETDSDDDGTNEEDEE